MEAHHNQIPDCFSVQKKIQIISKDPPDGTIVKKGGDVRLSCKTNHQWFFCVWRGPGDTKQVIVRYKLITKKILNLQV